jgi:hypothetical protein
MQNLSYHKNVSRNLNALLLLFIISLNYGCVTTHKGKALEWSVVGASLGAIYGATRPDYPQQNASMFAALGAAGGALGSLYNSDPDKKIDELKLETQKLKSELDGFSNPKVMFETPATFNSKIPEKYKKLISPGEWKISEIDLWVEDSENRLIHQDKIMDLIPPSLKPNSTGGNK